MLQPRRSPPVLSNGAGSTLSQAQVFSSFMFVDSSGAEHAVRWSVLPAAQPVPVSPAGLAKRGPDFLEQEITESVRGGPLRRTMVVTVANPGDPTADAPSGGRRRRLPVVRFAGYRARPASTSIPAAVRRRMGSAGSSSSRTCSSRMPTSG
jgi:hypothetical protein